MKRPIIFSVTEGGENAPIFSQGDYDVFVGALEENKLPMYVVINRNTKVVEFTSEVTLGYQSWLDSIAEATAQREGRGSKEANGQKQLPLSLAMKN